MDLQFFQVFLPKHNSETLQIPKAFQGRISGKLPSRVILKNREGKLWPVVVAEDSGGLCFRGGWSKFVNDNSMAAEEFLVFKYNGHHIFEVIILGTSGCERGLEDEEGDDGDENGEEGDEDEDDEDMVDDNKGFLEDDDQEEMKKRKVTTDKAKCNLSPDRFSGSKG